MKTCIFSKHTHAGDRSIKSEQISGLTFLLGAIASVLAYMLISDVLFFGGITLLSTALITGFITIYNCPVPKYRLIASIICILSIATPFALLVYFSTHIA